MKYEDMSDFEINKAVSRLVDFGDLVVTVNDGNEVVYLCDKDGFFDMVPISHFDPCTNPSDAWPIIVDNKLSLEPDANLDLYLSATRHYEFTTTHQNPLRAAMICFLKMKDAQQ